jgi:adenylosuccinate lyase
MLQIVINVARGLVVYPKVIEAYVMAELPFMATEEILMAGVRAGGDRQELHERIRQHSLAAAQQVKEHGRPNDLIARLRKDLAFKGIDVERVLNPSAFVGRAPQQVEHFVRTQVEPVRSRYRQQVQQGVQLRV